MVNKQSTLSSREAAALNTRKGTAAELGEIEVFIDGHTETSRILEFAGTLAQARGARLISVFMQPEHAVTAPEVFGSATRTVLCEVGFPFLISR